MSSLTKIIFAMLFTLCFFTRAWSQDGDHKKVNYSKNPHWIQMMDDPNVNYHEAVKAFEEFWKDRGEPEVEEAETGEKKEVERSLLKRLFKSDEKLKEENSQYVIQYKRFKQWKRD